VGDRGSIPKVASPVFKQSFDLRTGQCLDETEVRVPCFEARVRDGRVELLAESPDA
jgi:nitrite reductase (NADH) small subunit